MKNLPIYLSTGMSTIGEVDEALEVFLEEGVQRENHIDACIGHPAPENQINLRALESMKVVFGCPVGYSDHSLGITAPVMAVTLGAVGLKNT